MIKRTVRSNLKLLCVCSLPVLLTVAACGDGTTLGQIDDGLANGDDVSINISTDDEGNIVIGASTDASDPVGAVFAMTNGVGQPNIGENVAGPNAVVSYARADDGTLTFVGSFPTGDLGGDFDGGEGLDPLISANAVELTPDNSVVLAVNAGSNSVSSFIVNEDMSLTLVSTVASGGTGPNSIATDGERVYVTNIDADGVFTGEADQVGNVTSFTLDEAGGLVSTGYNQELENRPSNIRLSSDDNYIVISSLTAGSSELPNDSIINENTAEDGPDEIVVHPVSADGVIMPRSGSAISSFRGVRSNDGAAFVGPDEPEGNDPVNTDVGAGRNLPSPIGILVASSTIANVDTVVVTETREFNSFGGPPTLPNLEAGSLSTFSLDLTNGTIVPAAVDVTASGPGDPNQLTLCWVVAVPLSDGSMVAYVSNTINSLISSFSIDGEGGVSLLEGIAAAGEGPFPAGTDNTDLDPANGPLGAQVFGNTEGYIDMDLSDDDQYLYQLTGLAGTIEVYQRNDDFTLTHIQTVDEETADGEGALPNQNTQGIVSF